MIVARREERLRELARRAREVHGVDATPVVADLATDDGLAACRDALDAAPPPEVAILNAGFGTRGRLWELDREREADDGAPELRGRRGPRGPRPAAAWSPAAPARWWS